MDLLELRQKIDDIDQQIVSLFSQRMAVSAQIAAWKKEQNVPIFVPQREEEKLEAVASQVSPELHSYVQELYQTLFSLSRSYQESQL